MNLYGFCGGNPVNESDPSGLDWVDNLSNFSAGAGDSLTCGLTAGIRQAIGVDDIVDKSGGYYIGGEVTETVVEVAATGGSALLKKAAVRAVARKAAEEGVSRAAAGRLLRRESEEVIARKFSKKELAEGTAHHINPLKGHPIHLTNMKPVRSLFPTIGLPAIINGSRLNVNILGHEAHMAAHLRLSTLEGFAMKGFNRYTMGARIGFDIYRPMINQR